MTHTLDIGTDLDDLLASIGDLTIDTDDAVEPVAERPALVSSRMFLAAWYQ
jgi:hypothetical protein